MLVAAVHRRVFVRLIVLLAAWLPSRSLSAQPANSVPSIPTGDVVSYVVEPSFHYFACVRSTGVADCYAFTDEQKRACQCSGTWETRFYDHELELKAFSNAYSVKPYTFGNEFVADVMKSATVGDAIFDPNRSPYFREIRRWPGREGYLSVPKAIADQPGMLYCGNNFGGIALDSGETWTDTSVFYSSTALKGRPNRRSHATNPHKSSCRRRRWNVCRPVIP